MAKKLFEEKKIKGEAVTYEKSSMGTYNLRIDQNVSKIFISPNSVIKRPGGVTGNLGSAAGDHVFSLSTFVNGLGLQAGCYTDNASKMSVAEVMSNMIDYYESHMQHGDLYNNTFYPKKVVQFTDMKQLVGEAKEYLRDSAIHSDIPYQVQTFYFLKEKLIPSIIAIENQQMGFAYHKHEDKRLKKDNENPTIANREILEVEKEAKLASAIDRESLDIDITKLSRNLVNVMDYSPVHVIEGKGKNVELKIKDRGTPAKINSNQQKVFNYRDNSVQEGKRTNSFGLLNLEVGITLNTFFGAYPNIAQVLVAQTGKLDKFIDSFVHEMLVAEKENTIDKEMSWQELYIGKIPRDMQPIVKESQFNSDETYRIKSLKNYISNRFRETKSYEITIERAKKSIQLSRGIEDGIKKLESHITYIDRFEKNPKEFFEDLKTFSQEFPTYKLSEEEHQKACESIISVVDKLTSLNHEHNLSSDQLVQILEYAATDMRTWGSFDNDVLKKCVEKLHDEHPEKVSELPKVYSGLLIKFQEDKEKQATELSNQLISELNSYKESCEIQLEHTKIELKEVKKEIEDKKSLEEKTLEGLEENKGEIKSLQNGITELEKENSTIQSQIIDLLRKGPKLRVEEQAQSESKEKKLEKKYNENLITIEGNEEFLELSRDGRNELKESLEEIRSELKDLRKLKTQLKSSKEHLKESVENLESISNQHLKRSNKFMLALDRESYNMREAFTKANESSELLRNFKDNSLNLANSNLSILLNNEKLSTEKFGEVKFLPEADHVKDHGSSVQSMINDINSGRIGKNTAIALELKNYGENLGMPDVIMLANIIEHNKRNPDDKLIVPIELETNSLIFQDALLYNAAKEKGIPIVGLEGKGLHNAEDKTKEGYKGSEQYNNVREAYMIDTINELTSRGYNVIANVGSKHVPSIQQGIVSNLSKDDMDIVPGREGIQSSQQMKQANIISEEATKKQRFKTSDQNLNTKRKVDDPQKDVRSSTGNLNIEIAQNQTQSTDNPTVKRTKLDTIAVGADPKIIQTLQSSMKLLTDPTVKKQTEKLSDVHQTTDRGRQ